MLSAQGAGTSSGPLPSMTANEEGPRQARLNRVTGVPAPSELSEGEAEVGSISWTRERTVESVGQRGSTGVLTSKATRVSTRNSYEEERLLIDRVKAGEYEAFEAIFRRHVAQVYRQVFKLIGNEAETEEVVQDVFLAVYEKIKSFRGDSAFSTWLYRLAMNVAITKLRRRKRSKEVFIEDYLPRFQEDGHHLVRPVFNWGDEVDFRLEKEELQRLILEALNELPPVDKAVIVQSDLEGLSNRDIGDALGLSIPAVKARLHRARLFLRGRLATSLGYSPT